MLELYPTWHGLPLIPSRAAMEELYKYGLTLEDVKEILEQGYQGKKRSEGTFERCLEKKKIIVKAVVSKSFNYSLDSACWLVVHIGVIKR